MNKKTFITNIKYTLTSNVLSFCISALITFFVPKVMGMESYGYFQLYLFYTSYTGFFCLGWHDGLYLRYGGEYYDRLDKHCMSGQFWSTICYELIVALLMSWFAYLFVAPEEKVVIIICTGIYIILVWPKTLLIYILQMTNRIREYSRVVIVERIVFLIVVVLFLLFHKYDFLFIILADWIGKIVALALTVVYCWDIVKCKPDKTDAIVNEIRDNIVVGFKLMISNIASMLIVGGVRFAIERQWDIGVFGKVSLTLSISNMLMVLVNAVALVMFPALRRTEKEQYARIYVNIRNILMFVLLALLVLYYPVKTVLLLWLPQYEDGLNYLAILFPLCVFESKNSLLITTYMKTLRKEKDLLIANICSMVFSFALILITVFYLKNLDLAILSIVVAIAFRCVISELMTARALKISVIKDIAYEIVTVSVFIYTSWNIGGVKGLLIYLVAYITYLVAKKNELVVYYQNGIKYIKKNH